MTSESYHPQSVDPDEIVKDSNLPTVTRSYHPQSIGPSNDMQSDPGHDSVALYAPLGGKILEFIMVTNNTSMIIPTLTNQQTWVMLLEALVRTSPPKGNYAGVRVEAALNVTGLCLR